MMLRIVAERPYTMWPLQGIAVGLLAGVAGFAYDEPAAAVVDTLPRGLAWRTAARSLGVLLLLTWWLVVVSATGGAYFGHARDVALQGVVAVAAVAAAAAHLRLRGHASPAGLLATGVVGAAAYLSLARPFDDLLVVFPYTASGEWSASRARVVRPRGGFPRGARAGAGRAPRGPQEPHDPLPECQVRFTRHT